MFACKHGGGWGVFWFRTSSGSPALLVQLAVDAVVALEFGYYLLHFAHHLHVVAGVQYLPHLFVGAVDGIERIFAHLGTHDFGVVGGHVVLFGGKQLLVEFFAGTEAGFHNLYVFEA